MSLLRLVGLGKELVNIVDCHAREGDEILVANGIEEGCLRWESKCSVPESNDLFRGR